MALNMVSKNIADMTHLFPDDTAVEMPDELLEFRDYLGHIIGSATVTNEIEFISPIPCRKKLNRKSCLGFVKIITQELPESFLHWHCSACNDSGRIVHWRGCCADRSEFARRRDQDDEPDPSVEATISREEMKALLRGGLYDPDSERIVYSARHSKTGILLRGRYGDMDNFEGFLAADANHEENKKRQRLICAVHDKVYDAIQNVYDKNDLGTD